MNCRAAILLLVAVGPILAGCQTAATTPSSRVTMRVLVAPAGSAEPVAAPSGSSIGVMLSTIRGSLVGDDDGSPVVVLPGKRSGTIELDLDMIGDLAAKTAMPVAGIVLNQGMQFQPADVRIARVSTFAVDGRTGRPLSGGTGFWDVNQRKQVLLVYFDRACSVTGTAQWPPDPAKFEFSVPTAGLHWLLLDDGESGYAISGLTQPSQVAIAAGWR